RPLLPFLTSKSGRPTRPRTRHSSGRVFSVENFWERKRFGGAGEGQVGRGAPAGRTVGLPISGPGLTMGVGRLSAEVKMAVEAIEREMDDAYLRLAAAAAAVRYRQRHYLDGRGAGSLFGPATALTAA